MVFLLVIAAFFALGLLSWLVYALTHPVAAGQGILIFLCKALGVISLLAGAGMWISQSFLQALPALGIMLLAFIGANRLESRWRNW